MTTFLNDGNAMAAIVTTISGVAILWVKSWQQDKADQRRADLQDKADQRRADLVKEELQKHNEEMGAQLNKAKTELQDVTNGHMRAITEQLNAATVHLDKKIQVVSTNLKENTEKIQVVTSDLKENTVITARTEKTNVEALKAANNVDVKLADVANGVDEKLASLRTDLGLEK